MSNSTSGDHFEDMTRVATSRSGGGPRVTDAGPGLQAGTVFGNYRIVARLGEGGMGEVYEAEHTFLQQRYAMKLLHADLAGDAAGRERFVREARVMASLHHKGIIRVDDFGETAGRVWLRMELADGVEVAPAHRVRTLGELVAFSGGRLSPAVVRDALTQILDALAVAHQRGLVHRDLKPANILLDGAGLMKVADFGLVQMMGDEWLRSRVSATVARSATLGSAPTLVGGDKGSASLESGERALMGTWDFMSPEQKAGDRVDARSDLYAVGLIAFRMLTGECVLAMEMPSEIVEGLDPAWDTWIRRAVATRPDRRFSSAAEMAAALPGTRVGPPELPTLADEPAAAPEPVVEMPAAEPPPVAVARSVEPPPMPDASRKVAPEPPPLPLQPGAQDSAAGQGAPSEVGDVRAAFDRVAMRLVPACIWSIPFPWLGLTLRGHPVLAALLGLAVPISLAIAVGTGWLPVETLIGAAVLSVLVAIGVLISDGGRGPFERLARAEALARARSLANHGITAAAIAGFCALIAVLAVGVGVVSLVDEGPPFRTDDLLAITSLAASFVLLLWFSIRNWRIYRAMSALSSGRGSVPPPHSSQQKR